MLVQSTLSGTEKTRLMLGNAAYTLRKHAVSASRSGRCCKHDVSFSLIAG